MNQQDISNALTGNNQQIQQAQNAAQSYQPEVNGDIAQTQGALTGVQNYQQSLQQPQNQLGNIYNQGLTNYNSLYGVNPQAIQQANQVLAQTQDTMAALPQAIQQGANGRMVTGAQEANRYSQAVAPVQQQLTNQGNALQALQANAGLAQTAAGQFMTGQGQSQQMQLGALQSVYSDALQKQQQAQSMVQYYSTLQQQGYNVDAQLGSAQAALNQAAAAAVSAQAAMQQANVAQGQLTLNQQAAQQATQQKTNEANATQPRLNPLGTNPQPTVNVPAAPAGMNGGFNPFGVGVPGGLLGFL